MRLISCPDGRVKLRDFVFPADAVAKRGVIGVIHGKSPGKNPEYRIGRSSVQFTWEIGFAGSQVPDSDADVQVLPGRHQGADVKGRVLKVLVGDRFLYQLHSRTQRDIETFGPCQHFPAETDGPYEVVELEVMGQWKNPRCSAYNFPGEPIPPGEERP